MKIASDDFLNKKLSYNNLPRIILIAKTLVFTRYSALNQP